MFFSLFPSRTPRKQPVSHGSHATVALPEATRRNPCFRFLLPAMLILCLPLVMSSQTTPGLTLSTTSVDFGTVPLRTAAQPQTVTLTSSGTAPLIINSETLSATQAFNLSGPEFPLTLNPGQTATLTIGFDPGGTGTKTGTVTLTSNATPSRAIIELSGTSVPAGLTVSAGSIAFGDVASGSPATPQTLTLTSSGSVPLTISSEALSGSPAFSVSGASFPLTLNPGQTANLTIGFTPSGTGTRTGTITLSGNTSPETTTIDLSGTSVVAALTASATSVAFGNVTMGIAATPQTVTLTSSGGLPVTISAAAVSGAPAFNLTGPSFPLTLDPGQSATLTIGFTPAATGVKGATLSVTSNATPGAMSIALKGTGIAPGVLSSLSCSSGSMTGAGTDTCTVALTAPAGNSGLAVNLTSSNANVTVPASENVQPGAASATFAASVQAVTTTQTVTLTATGGSATATYGLQLNAALPTLTLSVSSVSFGDVMLNSPATQTVTLMSTGTAPLTVSGASVTGTGFSVSGISSPMTLNPGDQATMNVQFDPAAAGAAAGAVSVNSNCSMGGGPMGVSLSGTGQAPVEEVELSWDAPTGSSDPVAGYNIYRAVSGSSTYQLLNAAPDATTSYTDSTVTDGTTYVYYVESVDAEGNLSVPSNTYSVSIPAA